jgi:hypothetical protein
MLEPRFGLLERGRHVEYLPAVLDRNDAPIAETRTVAGTVDDIDDVGLDIAGAQEIGVQRVHDAILDGRARSAQGLAQDLPAVDARAADIPALAAEDIVLDALELEQMQQVGKDRLHGLPQSLRFSRAIRLEVSQRRPPMPSTSA